MTLRCRPYLSPDRSDCVAVFRSNIPRYFREFEQAEFESFIESGDGQYFVVEQDGRVVGCGGYGVHDGSGRADLCWGMVTADDHGNRIGEFLLLARLNLIAEDKDLHSVRLATCQHTEGFFQKYGFVIQSRRQSGIDDGLDEVEMRLTLSSDTRDAIHNRWRMVDGQDPNGC